MDRFCTVCECVQLLNTSVVCTLNALSLFNILVNARVQRACVILCNPLVHAEKFVLRVPVVSIPVVLDINDTRGWRPFSSPRPGVISNPGSQRHCVVFRYTVVVDVVLTIGTIVGVPKDPQVDCQKNK